MLWIRSKSFSRKQNCKNVHTLFRKSFTADNDIKEATLTFTADDYCKVYINGKFIISGPAPGYLHHYYYMSVDIKQHLQPGENCIAVHCFYQGLENRVWNSGDDFAGLKASLDIAYVSGKTEAIATDETWCCYDCQAYQSDRTFGYDTQFAEDIDMRLYPVGWIGIDFDYSEWQPPEIVDYYPHDLNEQPTLALSWQKISPKNIKFITDGHYLIDFGREVVGCSRLCATGENGHVITIRHAEELNEDGTARYKMRATCEYQEYLTLSGGPEVQIEFFDYKAFRYIELINYPGQLSYCKVAVLERTYPFDNASEIKTSDKTLNKILDICSLAVKLGTQDSYLDCMSREKGAYLGDAYVTGLSHLYLTGRSEMLKKVLSDFAASAVYCPGLLAIAPGAFHQDIADYSLLFVPLLHEYYMWTGDTGFVRDMLPVIDGLLGYFSRFENHYGLLEDLTGKPVMIDWPDNLRDGYESDGLMDGGTRQSGMNTVINLYYYGTVAATAKIFAAVGNSEKSTELSQKSNKLNNSLKKFFLSDKGFVNTCKSTQSSMHSNALALMFEVVSLEEAAPVIALLKEKRMKCGVYFAFFLLKGLFNYGEYEFAYDLMTCDDIHSWQTMLKDGATTCMEVWGVEQKWNTSLCHPWASAPVYMVAAYIFGLKPAEPGWEKIIFTPHIPEAMQHGSISINIPQGRLSVAFTRENGIPQFSIKTPENVELIQTV